MAKKIAKLKKLVSPMLRDRILASSEEERAALRDVIEKEKADVVARMEAKGFRLEATVAGVYGLFTRGQAQGTLERVSPPGAGEAGEKRGG